MLLTKHFIKDYNEMFDREIKGVTPRVEEIFRNYSWPGNVRELRHSIEHAMNLVEGSVIDERQLPFQITQIVLQPKIAPGKADLDGGLPEAVRLFEKEIIMNAMQQCAGNVSKAARRLQLPRQTLQYKLNNYGIAAGQF